jgi:hypothetical protein
MFASLRLDSLIVEFMSFAAKFSIAQIGGIPRLTDCFGVLF